MKAEEQFAAFEADIKQINKKFTKSRSSLKDLFEKLEKQIKDKKIAALDVKAETEAITKSKPDGDEKLALYKPALDALFEVWGTANEYEGAHLHFAFHETSNPLAPKKLKNRLTYKGDKLPNLPKIHKRGAIYDYLIFYGAHGDCHNGQPTKLNELSLKSVQALVKKFSEPQVTFKNIVLDCCLTASFIPELVPLLAKTEANIISYWGIAAGIIAEDLDKHVKLADAVCAYIDATTKGVVEFTGTTADEAFQPVVLYVHGTKTLYRKKYTSAETSFKGHPASDANDWPDLPAMDKFLKGKGVKNFNEVNTADLKKAIKANVTVNI